MITHLFPIEFVAIADALATPDAHALSAQLAALPRFNAQTNKPRTSPCLVFSVDPQRLYNGGNAAYVRLTLTIESTAGDEEKSADANHLARVTLVKQIFLTEAADRIAEINARGKLIISAYGQQPGKLDAGSDATGEKLRSQIVLFVAGKLPPPPP